MDLANDMTLHWHVLPVAVPLASGEVHAWLLDLDSPQTLDETLLDPDERLRARRLKVPTDRRHFIRRRVLARHLLAGILGVSPATIAWSVGPRGRLFLGAATLDFNWSSSDNLFLFAATSNGCVGADIAKWRDDIDFLALAESALPQSEAIRLRSLPAAQRCEAFWLAWTAHEAPAKARGAGIAQPAPAVSSACRLFHRVSQRDWIAAVAWF